MGSGILPETIVGKHNLPCHLQMPAKFLSCKKEAICEHGSEVSSCPVGQGSFKMDFQSGNVFYGQTSPNLTFLLEIIDGVSSGLKRREGFQRVISIQFKSQHIWWYVVHKCIRYLQRARFGRHYECWKVYKGFRATSAPHLMTFQRRPCLFQQDNTKPHTAAIKNSMASVE